MIDNRTPTDEKLQELVAIIQADPAHLRATVVRTILAVALAVASLAAIRLLQPEPRVWLLACVLDAAIFLGALVILAVVWLRQRKLEAWLLKHKK